MIFNLSIRFSCFVTKQSVESILSDSRKIVQKIKENCRSSPPTLVVQFQEESVKNVSS